MKRPRLRLFGCAVAALALVATVAPAQRQSQENSRAAGGNAAAKTRFPPPDRPVLFQPMLVWDGAEPTTQGTGFFAKAPGGKVAAVSSAHFINFDGPPLREARWLDLKTGKPVATFDKSWGKPGSPGTMKPQIDLRPDHWVMPAAGDAAARAALELDDRPQPKVGERVWFPDKDQDSPLGFSVIEGTVVEADPKYSAIRLSHNIQLQSQSGSPVISQETGKVIGALSRGGEHEGRSIIVLAPAASLVKVLSDSKLQPPLREVIGKPGVSGEAPKE